MNTQVDPKTTSVSMVDALNLALHDAMTEDPNVLVFGEDVGVLGGVFRVTSGLANTFGPDRCFDTPIAESGIIGMAIGMTALGLRPVVELQFDAFGYPAMEQIFSHLAKLRNRTEGQWSVPIVVRVPYGGGIGAVEHHSDSSEAYFASTPGLKVYTPATVNDAYTMMREAIHQDDPVIFFEPKKLYWEKDKLLAPTSATLTPGGARVRKSGQDATLITYGQCLPVCLAAAKEAAAEGFDVGVVDLRSVVPFDEDTTADELIKTGRGIVVHESSGFCGVGAEITARLTELCFDDLEAPIQRVTGRDIPYPPPHLEHLHLPNVSRILDALATVL